MDPPTTSLKLPRSHTDIRAVSAIYHVAVSNRPHAVRPYNPAGFHDDTVCWESNWPYEILNLLGAGGMGAVYRARDTRLKRDVALKMLPDVFSADGERLARFQREAEVLASLNHPNIAAIYGLEESDVSTGSGQSVRALVLELVEGETLAERIARGPIPIDEALPIVRQIAFASYRGSMWGIYAKPADGSDGEERLVESDSPVAPVSWSRDERIVYAVSSRSTAYDFWMLPLSGARKPVPLLAGPDNAMMGQVSPNGKWLAYRSDEDGRNRVYVVSFPSGGVKRQVSTVQGSFPRWRADGLELFFSSGASGGSIMAVPVVGDSTAFEPGSPAPLFNPNYINFQHPPGYHPSSYRQTASVSSSRWREANRRRTHRRALPSSRTGHRHTRDDDQAGGSPSRAQSLKAKALSLSCALGLCFEPCAL